MSNNSNNNNNDNQDSLFPAYFTIEDARAAIQGRNDYIEIKREDHYIFTYLLQKEDSFLDPEAAPTPQEKFLRKIRRECRGLVFDYEGKIISRRFHKFFNINESEETSLEVLKQKVKTQSFVVLEKLDGSMIAPYFSLGKLRFASKKGVTSVTPAAEAFVENSLKIHGVDYVAFCTHCIRDLKLTPLFEWCSASDPIVLRHSEDKLILTGLRHMHTGQYIPYEEMKQLAAKHNIPVVGLWTGTREQTNSSDNNNNGEKVDVEKFLYEVYTHKDLEGYVMRFEDGQMYKIKTLWYSQLNKQCHIVTSAVTGKSTAKHEKTIWHMVLDSQLDDLKVWISEEERQVLTAFAHDLQQNVEKTAARMQSEVDDWKAREGTDRKKFLQGFLETKKRQSVENKSESTNKVETGIYWKIFDNHNAVEVVLKTIQKNITDTAGVNAVRFLAGSIFFNQYIPKATGTTNNNNPQLTVAQQLAKGVQDLGSDDE